MAAVALAGMVFLAGCGGGDDTPSPTKAEYTKSAKVVCKQTQQERQTEILALMKKTGTADDKDKERLVVKIAVPSFEGELEELDALGLPQGAEQPAEALLKTLEREIRKLEADPVDALEDGTTFQAARAKAAKLGLGECF